MTPRSCPCVEREAFLVAEVTKMKETLFPKGFTVLKISQPLSARLHMQIDQGSPGGAIKPRVT